MVVLNLVWYFLERPSFIVRDPECAFKNLIFEGALMGKWKYTGSDGYNKLLASGSFSQLYSSDFCQGQNRNQSKISQNMKQVSYHPILYVFRTPAQFIVTSRICLWGMKLDFIHIVKCLMALNNVRSDHKRSDKFCRPPANHPQSKGCTYYWIIMFRLYSQAA